MCRKRLFHNRAVAAYKAFDWLYTSEWNQIYTVSSTCVLRL